jgi:hypothetical protein
MGQTQSFIPSGKRFKYSYSKQLEIPFVKHIQPVTDLSRIIEIPPQQQEYHSGYISSFIQTVIYYNVQNIGYKIDICDPIETEGNLQNMIDQVIAHGVICSDKRTKISDLTITSVSYKINRHGIKSLLSQGHILIAGIVLDKTLGSEINVNITSIVTDVVLLVGYDDTSIYIISNWLPDVLALPDHFIDNILEIHTIEVFSPEDRYLEKRNELN